ncbi:MAG: radical SAM protein, partial [Deltaproteobacteria bacterium]|nr:radical SAM protein [Deltaproteobacteria bacterium]
MIRTCNLSCGCCNEYDDHSPPEPLEELLVRVDHLAELGCLVVTSISRAYPITKGWIERTNDTGLSLPQVSVDNFEPNEVSQKSWSKITKRLRLLQEHAQFKLNVNAVLGSSPPRQTRQLIDEIRSLGFYMTVGWLHDQQGQTDPRLIGDVLPEFYEEMQALCTKSFFHRFGEGWERQMLRGGTAPWRCRAGARYLY